MFSNRKKHWCIKRQLQFTFHFIHQRYEKIISYKMKYLAFWRISLVVLIVITKQILAHEDDIYQANRSKNRFCYPKVYRQPVSSDGCETIFIENKLCYGHCSSTYSASIYIKTTFNCSLCQPEHISKFFVKLTCSKEKFKIVEIGKIESCRCMKSNCEFLSHMKLLIEKNRSEPWLKTETSTTKNHLNSYQNGKIKRNRKFMTRKKKCLRKIGPHKTKCLAKWSQRSEKSLIDS